MRKRALIEILVWFLMVIGAFMFTAFRPEIQGLVIHQDILTNISAHQEMEVHFSFNQSPLSVMARGSIIGDGMNYSILLVGENRSIILLNSTTILREGLLVSSGAEGTGKIIAFSGACEESCDNLSLMSLSANITLALYPGDVVINLSSLTFSFADRNMTENITSTFGLTLSAGKGAQRETIHAERPRIGSSVRVVKSIRVDKRTSGLISDIPSEAVNVTVVKKAFGLEEKVDDVKIKDEGIVKDVDSFIRDRKKEEIIRKIGEAKNFSQKLELQMDLLSFGVSNPITGAVVADPLDMNTSVIIEETIESYEEVEIMYELPAPEAFEEIESSTKKSITISSSYPYTDVVAFMDLPSEAPADAVDLYWYENGGSARTEHVITSMNDTNGNGLIDYIEWIVPHLSDQVFVVEITVLNVQSYPTVGGLWDVRFNTTGTANLTIRTINGTFWDNESEQYDLLFRQLTCGDIPITTSWIHGGVFVQDYSCNLTSFEQSRVITEGKHHLQFTFGDQTAFANNFAAQLFANITAPENDSVYLRDHFNITVNATGNSTVNESHRLRLWIGNETSNITRLLAQQTGYGQALNITYNLTALPLLPDENMTFLLHFDNRSEFSENDSLVYDWTGNGYNATCAGDKCPVWNESAGKFAGAFQYNGSKNFSISNALPGIPAGSLAVWIKLDNISSDNTHNFRSPIFVKQHDGVRTQLLLGINATGESVARFHLEGLTPDATDISGNTSLRVGEWYHIVTTWNGSEHIIYVNGQQDAVKTDSEVLLADASPSYQQIGAWRADAEPVFFNGTIDEIALWNKTLSAGEILDLYRLKEGTYYLKSNITNFTHSRESDVYQINITLLVNHHPDAVLLLPLNNSQANASHVHLNVSGNDVDEDMYLLQVWVGNSSDNITRLVYQNTTVGWMNVSYNLTALPLIPDENMTLLLHFDNRSEFGENDSFVYDWTGTGHNATCEGSSCPLWNASRGKFGGGFTFNDQYECLNISKTAGLNITQQLSVSAWINTRNIEQTQGITMHSRLYSPSSYDDNYHLAIGDGGILHLTIINSTGTINSTTYPTNNILKNNTWHHIAGTYDGQTISLYVDGQLINQTTMIGDINGNNTDIYIGCFNDDGNFNYTFNGTIDEIGIWNRSLSSQEVLDLYRLGNGTYYWKANATDFVLDNQTNYWQFIINDSTIPPNNHPDAVLVEPINNSNVNATFVSLNVTGNDTDGDMYRVQLWVGNSTENITRLVYQNTTTGFMNVSYNLTALPLVAGEGKVLLLHLNNESEQGENNTDFHDFSGNNFNASCSPSLCPTLVAGKFGQALEFNGVDQYVNLTNNPTNYSYKNFTLAAWVYVNAYKPEFYISVIHTQSGFIEINGSGSVYFASFDNRNGSGLNHQEYLGNIPLRTWKHIAITSHENTTNLYTDGIIIGNATINNTAAGVYQLPLIGAIGDNPWSDRFFNGTIDEVAIWNKSLSASEILDLYRLKNGTYYWKANATDFVLDNQTNYWQFIINDSTIPPNNHPDTVLVEPVNDSQVNASHVHLNMTGNDTDGDMYRVQIWVGNSSDNITRLVYQNTTIGFMNVSYNLTALPVTSDENLTLLLHFDNRSEDGESNTVVHDYARDNDARCTTCPAFVIGTFAGAYNYTKSPNTYFNGSDAHLPLGNSPRTISSWIRLNDLPDTLLTFIIFAYGTDTVDQGNVVAIYRNTSGTFLRYAGWDDDMDIAVNLPTHEWILVTATYDGTTARLYHNGEEIANQQKTEWNTASKTYYVGTNLNLGSSFNGSIDEIAVWNKSLSAQEVLDLYRLGNGTYYWKANATDFSMINETDYWQFIVNDSTIAPTDHMPIINLTEPVNMSNVNASHVHLNFTANDTDGNTYRVQVWVGNSSDTITRLVYQNTTTGWMNVSYNLTALPLLPDESMILLMHLDNRSEFGENNSLVYDFSGLGDNGACSGIACPFWNESGGKFAGAFEFDGVNNSFEVLHNPLQHPNGTFSISLWVKPRMNHTNEILVGKVEFNSNNRSYDIGLSLNRPYMQFNINGSAAGWQQVTAVQSIPHDRWTFVAGAYNGTHLNIYVNGLLDNTFFVGHVNRTIFNSTANIVIGAHGSGGYNFFNGTLDDIAIWNRSLSSQEVLDLYRLGNGTYYWKANATDFALNNETAYWQFQINDSTPLFVESTVPGFHSNATNSTSATINDEIQLNITLVDNVAGQSYFLSWNLTGDWMNVTNGTWSGTSATVSVNLSLASATGHSISYRWQANDSVGNANISQYFVQSIGNIYPNVSLTSPLNGTNSSSGSIQFICNATDDISLANLTLYGNFSGTWQTNETASASGTSFGLSTSLALADGTYVWNCLAEDAFGAENFSAHNFTLIIDTSGVDSIPPYFTSVAINNTSPQRNTTVQVNVTLSDNIAGSNWYFAWNDSSTIFYNATNGILASGVVSLNVTINATRGVSVGYYWQANDTSNNWNQSSVYNFTVSNTLPLITSLNDSALSTSNTYLALNWTSNDIDNDAVMNYIWMNSSLGFTLNESTAGTGVYLSNLEIGTYHYKLHAGDALGNMSNTSIQSFTILDTTLPGFDSFALNTSTPTAGGMIQTNVTLLDNYHGAMWIFMWNMTGLWVNATNGSWDNGTIATINISLSGLLGHNISYRWWANDTSGNYNTSQTFWLNPLNSGPNVSLTSPLNGTNSTSPSVMFVCNATDDLSLANITLYGNFSGTWQANETVDSSGTHAGLQTTLTLMNGSYVWNCLAIDALGVENYSAVNYSLLVNQSGDAIPPWFSDPMINFSSPFISDVVQLNITLFDDSLGSSWWLAWNESGIWENVTIGSWNLPGTLISVNASLSGYPPRHITYVWFANDSQGNVNSTNSTLTTYAVPQPSYGKYTNPYYTPSTGVIRNTPEQITPGDTGAIKPGPETGNILPTKPLSPDSGSPLLPEEKKQTEFPGELEITEPSPAFAHLESPGTAKPSFLARELPFLILLVIFILLFMLFARKAKRRVPVIVKRKDEHVQLNTLIIEGRYKAAFFMLEEEIIKNKDLFYQQKYASLVSLMNERIYQSLRASRQALASRDIPASIYYYEQCLHYCSILPILEQEKIHHHIAALHSAISPKASLDHKERCRK